MSLATLDELSAAIGDYTLRSDLPIPLLLSNAEGKLRTKLRHPDMETTRTIAAAANGRGATLPVDCVEIRDVRVGITDTDTDFESGTPLQPMSVSSANRNFGTSTGYFRSGNTLVLVPKPASSTKLSLTYMAALTPLSAAKPANWLLTKFPQVYLHALLVEAYIFLRDTKAVAEHKSYLDEALAGVNDDMARSVMFGNTLIEEPRAW